MIKHSDQSNKSVNRQSSEAQQEIWKEVKTIHKNIQPRSNHSAVVYKERLYVYGGYERSVGIMDDFYYLNIKSLRSFRWKQVKQLSPTYPGPRKSHSAIVIGDQMLLFGGLITSSQSCRSLFSFDLEKKQWTEMSSDFPDNIDGHNVIEQEGKMILFGGYMSSNLGSYSNNIWSYDLSYGSWSQILANGKAPEPRALAGFCKYKDKIYLFGGTNGIRKFDDLWSFDFQSNQWSLIKCSNNLRIEQRHGLTLTSYNYLIFLFGGIRDVTRERNDMYVYNIQNSTWQMVQKEGIQLYFTKKFSTNQGLGLPQLTPSSSNFSQYVRTSQISPNNQNYRQLRHRSFHIQVSRQDKPQLQKKDKKLSPLMQRITKQFQQQQQYQLFFALNITLAHQQKKKQRKIEKAQFLSELEVRTDQERERLRMITPTTENLRQSLHMIGKQQKTMPLHRIGQSNLDKSTSQNLTQERQSTLDDSHLLEGKIPCARDGHTTNLVCIEKRPYLLIFGGDRHHMSFNDLFVFDMNSYLNE